MPNHVENRITFTGPGADEAIAALAGKGAVDFNSVKPMPESLHVTGRCDIEDAVLRDAGTPGHRSLANTPHRCDLSEENAALYDAMAVNLREHGHATWYGWAREHWGTKWNAYEVREEDGALLFQTAWSTPEPVMLALSAKFPDATITVEYADEDYGSNVGIEIFEGGVLEHHTQLSGERGRTMALRMHGVSCRECYCSIGEEHYEDCSTLKAAAP